MQQQSSERTAILASGLLFRSLPPADLARLAERLVPRTYPRGEVVFHRDDPAGALHFIREGQVKIVLTTEGGKETLLALFGAGECFGEIAALDGGARSATAVAVERTETLALLRDDLIAFLREHPDFALDVISLLAMRLRRLDERLEDAYFLDLDGRLARCLLDLAEQSGERAQDGVRVRMPLSQTDLAAMLGSTRVSVNRLLGAYQDAGIIAVERDAIVIKDVEGVRRRIER